MSTLLLVKSITLILDWKANKMCHLSLPVTNFEISLTFPAVEDDNIPFSSIALKTSPPQTKSPSYKIFSRNPLNETLLNSLFNKIDYQYHTWWHAYPKLQPSDVGYPPMVLDGQQLYYVNAMET